MKPRLQVHYEERVRAKLGEQFGFTNPHRIPRLEKIVVNVGLGEAPKNSKLLDSVVEELGLITGQRAVVTRARKSIANFSLREGMPIGAKVTLRGVRMYEFLDRLVNVALPRVRDFRGVPNRSFDGRGNYSLGVKEQLIFPEIDYDKVSESTAWTSCSSRRRTGMTRRTHCCARWACPSAASRPYWSAASSSPAQPAKPEPTEQWRGRH
jgi:large subunit ribosomal protein L5